MKRGLVYLILLVLAVVTLVPFAYLVCGSVKGTDDFFTSLFLPLGKGWFGIAWDRLTFSNFARLTREMNFGRYLLNSTFIASTTSVLATLFSAMGGYALAKFKFAGRTFITTVIVGALILPAALLIAPSYDLLYKLGLLDRFSGLILPAIAPAFGVFLFRQATLSSVPNALIEAARIDGCGEMRIFFTIALPMIRPMIGAFLMIVFLGAWNNFISPQIVMQSADKLPLSVGIAQLKGAYGQDYGLIMAGTVVSVVPVLLLFLMLQKEFIAGLTSGAVKG